MSKDLTIRPCGCEVNVERVGDPSSTFVLSAIVWADGEQYEVSGTYNLHSGGVRHREGFAPTTRSDWTKADIQRAITEVVERDTRVDPEDVDAIVELEIEERRAFVWQNWTDSSVQLYEQGVIPEGEYSGPDPEDYRDE